MEVEFSGGLRKESDPLNKMLDKPPLVSEADLPTATLTPDRHAVPLIENGVDKSVSQSEADDAPLIGEKVASSCGNEAASETLEEMESKYAAYVRHDTYGTMGKGDISLSEKALLVLGLFIMVPIKVVLILAILITYYLICRICTLFRSPYRYQGEEKEVDNSAHPLRKENEENNSDTKEFQLWDESQENYAHMAGLRRSIIVHSGRFLSRAVLFVLGFYYIKVTHRERTGVVENSNKQDEPLQDRTLLSGAIVSNHVSYLDILYHMSASFPSFVAKRSVGKLPLVGLISKCLGCVYVQREDKASDFKGVSGIVTERLQAAGRDNDAPIMMLFPEGTTTNGSYLLPFKTGAFLSQTPVQPVILKYPYKRFSPAWDTISGMRHVVFLLCQFINHLEVVWLPVYIPSEKEKLDPKLYASNVRQLMATEGSLTLSDIGLPEKRIYHTFLNDLLASEPSSFRVP